MTEIPRAESNLVRVFKLLLNVQDVETVNLRDTR